MPQYLGLAYPGRGALLINPLATAHEPEIASLMASVIAATSYVEARISASFAKFLGSKLDVGMALYGVLRGAAVQRRGVEETARVFFKSRPADLDLFRQALKKADAIGQDRNLVAHGMWVSASDLPGVLLRIPAQVYLDWFAEIPTPHGVTVDLARVDRNAVEVWSPDDFNGLEEDVRRVDMYFHLFWQSIEAVPTHIRTESRSQLEQQLSNHTRIFQRLP